MHVPSTHNTEAEILQRMIEPQEDGLDPGLSRYILSLDFKPADHQRMNELSTRAQEGRLSADEEQELDGYLSLGHFLALLQSKARTSLRHIDSAA